MNDISPLVLMFAMFVFCILLVAAGVAVWGMGNLKRTRLIRAIVQLEEILNLTNEALKTRATDKQNAVNHQIAEWDRLYSHELGVIIPELAWS